MVQGCQTGCGWVVNGSQRVWIGDASQTDFYISGVWVNLVLRSNGDFPVGGIANMRWMIVESSGRWSSQNRQKTAFEVGDVGVYIPGEMLDMGLVKDVTRAEVKVGSQVVRRGRFTMKVGSGESGQKQLDRYIRFKRPMKYTMNSDGIGGKFLYFALLGYMRGSENYGTDTFVDMQGHVRWYYRV